LDREALVNRNRAMAQAFHTLPYKHYVRRSILQTVARIPILPARHKRDSQERILLIRPDHLGDVLLTTPAIRALRESRPDAEIHALVGSWSGDILGNVSELDAVITLPFPGFSRSPKDALHSPYQLAWQSARNLRQIGYTSAIILRPDHWWGALLAYLAGIPERIGYDLPDVAPFLTHAIPRQHEHSVLQNLRLIEKWTGEIKPEDAPFSYHVSEADRAYIDGYLEEWGVQTHQPILCIHPGSGTWVKRWEEASWATVADTLTEQLDIQIVFTGGDHEMPIVRAIVEQMTQPACIMVGDTQVNQLAAIFSRARAVLGPDSGPLHLAAAVSTPTVTLYGPADPVEFGPWGPRDRHFVLTSDIGCRPCRVIDWAGDDPANHPCMQEISIARVLDAARRAAQYQA